nr:rps3 [Cordyceps militaris]
MKKNTVLRLASLKLHNILSKVPQKITLNNKIADIRKTKYLPSFSKEWKDTIYSYNQNTIKNIPSNHLNIHKIIQSYFNLFFSTKKNNENKRFIYPGKYITMKRRRNFLRKIYISNPDIKYTNNKAIITLFTLNRERNYLLKKYIKTNKKIQSYLMQRYLFLYKNNIMNIYNVLLGMSSYKHISSKSKFIQYKLKYLSKFLLLKNLYLKKVWSILIHTFIKRHLIFLRKYELLYSLNQLKFNKLTLLNKLSLLLNKFLVAPHKKVEYNIINLKSIILNSDLFTQALTLKFQKRKSFNYKKNILSILGRVNFPENTNSEGGRTSYILNKYKDGKILSYLSPKNNYQNLDKFINKIHSMDTNKNIHKNIFNSIQYKNIEGIRIETNGRLTKRYRADRAVHYKKWKGGLQKTSLHSTLFRGNVNPNISYSIANNTRRVGSFAIKGWISGK